VVTCPLAPDVPHLLSGSCFPDQVRDRLARAFGLGFLQTPPHGDALALLLAFGSAKTWRGDFHPTSSVPCPAHTTRLSRALSVGSERRFDHGFDSPGSGLLVIRCHSTLRQKEILDFSEGSASCSQKNRKQGTVAHNDCLPERHE
jgi:hypothetical protein